MKPLGVREPEKLKGGADGLPIQSECGVALSSETTVRCATKSHIVGIIEGGGRGEDGP